MEQRKILDQYLTSGIVSTRSIQRFKQYPILMLLSHLGKYPCEYENLKFAAKSLKMVLLVVRNTEKNVRPNKCHMNTNKQLRILANSLRIKRMGYDFF